jgi:HEAT repeat protein
MGKTLLFVAILSLPARPALPAPPASPASPAPQVSFEQAIQDLRNSDADVRLRAAQMLKEAAYPEAAVPLARTVTDPVDEIQLQAIAAELNTFLADKIVVKKRVGLIVEVRNQIVAEAAFSAGPLTLGPRPVPPEVLSALRDAAHDDNPRVALEAMYAFGTLAVQPGGAARRELLRASVTPLSTSIGAADPALRYAALRVIGRMFEPRRQDEPVDHAVGDAVISVLNERDRTLRITAMQALAAMRYERAVQALTDLYQHYRKGDDAAAALEALARIGHASSLPLFTAQLQTRNAPLRAIAIDGIARIGDRAQFADVEKALVGERNDNILLAGAFASVLLGNSPIDTVVESLAKPKLHDQARQYLVEIAAARPGVLARHAQDPDARIRTDVADVLGLAGDPAALPLAEALQKDADPQVARAGERAVARLKAAS